MEHSHQNWNIPPDDLQLLPNEVHVWCASLEAPTPTLQEYIRFLSDEEIARANQFHFEKDRHHFIAAHGTLRMLLGHYLHRLPKEIRFCSNSYGKPFLDLSPDENELFFNISHSHTFALFAFTHQRHIGVDIEYMRPGVEYELLAQHHFSPNENEALRLLPLSEREEAFYRCWTRKEAYIKARGKGLSITLSMFDVSLKPDEPAMLLRSREEPHKAERWRLEDLGRDKSRPYASQQPYTSQRDDEYAAALAVEGHDWELRCFMV